MLIAVTGPVENRGAAGLGADAPHRRIVSRRSAELRAASDPRSTVAVVLEQVLAAASAASDATSDQVREWATAVGTVGAAIFAGWAALTSRGASMAAEKSATSAERAAAAAEQEAAAARDQIATAREQVGIARLSVQAQIQPVLIDEPLDLSIEQSFYFPEGPTTMHPGGIVVADVSQERRGRLSIPVRNKGRGPAEIKGVGVTFAGRDGEAVVGPACNEITRHVLPVDESARLNFWFTADDLGDRWDAWQHTFQYGSFSLEVTYGDLAANPNLISHFVIQRRDRAHYG